MLFLQAGRGSRKTRKFSFLNHPKLSDSYFPMKTSSALGVSPAHDFIAFLINVGIYNLNFGAIASNFLATWQNKRLLNHVWRESVTLLSKCRQKHFCILTTIDSYEAKYRNILSM